MASVILVTLTVTTLIGRYLTILKPLYGRIPVRFQWVPSALLAAAAVVSTQLATCTKVEDYVAALLTGVVGFALAAQEGYHA